MSSAADFRRRFRRAMRDCRVIARIGMIEDADGFVGDIGIGSIAPTSLRHKKTPDGTGALNSVERESRISILPLQGCPS